VTSSSGDVKGRDTGATVDRLHSTAWDLPRNRRPTQPRV
jgi:hypothetical protein